MPRVRAEPPSLTGARQRTDHPEASDIRPSLPSRAARALRSTLFVLGAGAVSWAWSEVGFWARFRADDSPLGWVITWLAYSLVVAVVLRVVRRFPQRGAASVVFVGALYGWLVEGVVAATVYAPLPSR
jgi:hypothetical protein